jgi:hypothetical protein
VFIAPTILISAKCACVQQRIGQELPRNLSRIPIRDSPQWYSRDKNPGAILTIAYNNNVYGYMPFVHDKHIDQFRWASG